MEGIHPHDHTDEVTKWDLILPISPVTGAVYLEPDLSYMPIGTPRVVEILPSRLLGIIEAPTGLLVKVVDAGVLTLHEKYHGRANEVAYWFEVAADLIKEQQ